MSQRAPTSTKKRAQSSAATGGRVKGFTDEERAAMLSAAEPVRISALVKKAVS